MGPVGGQRARGSQERGIAASIADESAGALEPFESYSMVEPPAHDPATHKAVQIAPKKAGGVLTQKWKVVALDADELAIREAERLAQEQAEREANRIIITRTQGLITLYRLKGVQEAGHPSAD